MQDMMGSMDIAFPNLGIYLKNVPKTFTVFGFPIALYGVIIAIGVLAGVLLAAKVAKAGKAGSGSDLGFRDLRDYLFHHRGESLLCDFFVGQIQE